MKKYKEDMTVKSKRGDDTPLFPPWKDIILTPQLWLATMQATAQAWSTPMMILMLKATF